MKYMQKQGFRVIPVNPGLAGQSLNGETNASLTMVEPHADLAFAKCNLFKTDARKLNIPDYPALGLGGGLLSARRAPNRQPPVPTRDGGYKIPSYRNLKHSCRQPPRCGSRGAYYPDLSKDIHQQHATGNIYGDPT